mmetsp:Transcript_97845/g.279825  ORF Transcript_97845/g.279825 Transcript_97845/m.279825 type:complete len:573 (+) Transcript_97845:73-1791(+)
MGRTRHVVAILAVNGIIGGTVLGFPNSQNPFAGGPAVAVPSEDESTSCSVTLFNNASLDLYGLVETNWYDATSCPGPWSKVVLEWSGSVAGVQFDRAGALWVAGVEILRTTTPEPDTPGIEWAIERDVTHYSTLFTESANATLQIPNTVNSQYTGVLYITASLVFYSDSATVEGKSTVEGGSIPDAIIPLSDPTLSSDPWSYMGIQGNNSKVANFSFPRPDIVGAKLDLYASGHGCEEFWYSNVPGNYSGQLGICGGGSYRQIEVYVDGQLAGLAYPFPVIYTGGINPLLWRPLTGIYSFNIPPYTFDLTPFAGVMNDMEEHTISINVVDNNNQGSWFVDPVLLLEFADPDVSVDDATPLLGELTDYRSAPVVVGLEVEEATDPGLDIQFTTTGNATLDITGTIGDSSHTVSYTLGAYNLNSVGAELGVTVGEMTSTATSTWNPSESSTESSTDGHSRTVSRRYPYTVISDYATTANDFQIFGYVDYADATDVVSSDGSADASWMIHAVSNATYNRTNDYVYNKQVSALAKAAHAPLTYHYVTTACQTATPRHRLCRHPHHYHTAVSHLSTA